MAAERVALDVEKLRAFMQSKGWNTTKMAAEMGVSEATVSRALSDRRGVGTKFLAGLRKAGVKDPFAFLA